MPTQLCKIVLIFLAAPSIAAAASFWPLARFEIIGTITGSFGTEQTRRTPSKQGNSLAVLFDNENATTRVVRVGDSLKGPTEAWVAEIAPNRVVVSDGQFEGGLSRRYHSGEATREGADFGGLSTDPAAFHVEADVYDIVLSPALLDFDGEFEYASCRAGERSWRQPLLTLHHDFKAARPSDTSIATHPRSAGHWLWAYVRIEDSASNSFFVRIVQGGQEVVNSAWHIGTPRGEWAWVSFPEEIALSGESVTIFVDCRESGAKISKLVLGQPL